MTTYQHTAPAHAVVFTNPQGLLPRGAPGGQAIAKGDAPCTR
jgi:hypothetical protein